jgi:hypothetical protein
MQLHAIMQLHTTIFLPPKLGEDVRGQKRMKKNAITSYYAISLRK